MAQRGCYRYPHKCLKCSLHYNVYSDDDDWSRRHFAFCPECGVQRSIPMGREHLLDTFIFEVVPGSNAR